MGDHFFYIPEKQSGQRRESWLVFFFSNFQKFSEANNEISFSVKCGISPVKCLQTDYSNVKNPPSGGAADPFGFDSTFEGSTVVNSTTATVVPTQPKPRKFFKSRGSEDTAKNTSVAQTFAQTPSESVFSTLPTNVRNTENLYGNSYSSNTTAAYSSPTTYSPQSKTGKRGRGRPRGSKNTSPRSAALGRQAASTSTVTRGSRGRGRRGKGGRPARGSGAGRGKRKRQEWEESESEDQGPSSEEEMEEEEIDYGAQQFQPQQPTWEDEGAAADDDAEEEEDAAVETEADVDEGVQDEKNGHKEEEEPFKPPIKLRIIRRNDTNAFVSKVQAEDSVSSDPPEGSQMDTSADPVPAVSLAQEEDSLSSPQTSAAGEEHAPEPSPPSNAADRRDDVDFSETRVSCCFHF